MGGAGEGGPRGGRGRGRLLRLVSAPGERDDASLLDSARDGDRGAVEQLASRHDGALRGLLLRLEVPPGDPLDRVVEAAWAEALSPLEAPLPEESLAARLFRAALAHADRAAPPRTAASAEVDPGPAFEAETGGATRMLSGPDGAAWVDEALRSLPRAERAALLLCHKHGLTAREVAHALGRDREAVASLVAAALRRLRVRAARDAGGG